MASSRERQRALERAKVERRIARQAAVTRRRRQVQASIGAGLALVLIVVGAVWLLGGFDSEQEPTDNVASGTCTWFQEQIGGEVLDTGTPPTSGEARSGTSTLTIKTSQGEVQAELDHEKAPCTTSSMNYLAGRGYFDNTTCHRLTTEGIFVLQCGDPKATGSGGPAYRFANEYVPPPGPDASPPADPSGKPQVVYPKGTLAMAHSAEPDSNGSQFFIVYKDSPLAADYTVFGRVTKGLDVVEKVAAGGVEGGTKDGKPKTEVKITALTVTGVPTPGTATPGTATPAPGTPQPTPSASAGPTSPPATAS